MSASAPARLRKVGLRASIAVRRLPEVEDVLVRLGPLHAFLVVLLPDLRPRPVVPVGDAVLDDRARRNGLQAAVHVPERLLTFFPLVAPIGIRAFEKR